MAIPFQQHSNIGTSNSFRSSSRSQESTSSSLDYGSRAFLDVRIHLTTVLQTSLDISEILQIFLEEIQVAVAVDGVNFQHTAYKLDINLGEQQRHSCNYRLISENNVLGDITFSRAKIFSEQELCVLESLISALVCPLRNGLMYLEALQTAMKDPLTGLGSRAALENSLSRDLGLAKRHCHPFSLLIVDIDKFKGVNDKYGHSAGDAVLKEVAQAIAAAARQTDQAFRYGGEEFVVLLEKTDEDGAITIAERIRRNIEKLVPSYQGKKIPTTASIGVATVGKNDSTEALFDRADQALYHAKNNGRNQVITSSSLVEVL